MKKLLLSSVALTVLAVGPALAADLPRKAPAYQPPPPPPFSWTGFYVGVSGGFISQDSVATDLGNSHGQAAWQNVGDTYGISGIGGLFGGNIGYNWQFAPNWVLGIEADISWSGVDNSFISNDLRVGSKLDYLGTVRGRIGYAWDRALFYATGGFAYGKVKNTFDCSPADPCSNGYNLNTNETETGWTVGGGLEYAFFPNWTARAEALYVDLGTTEGVCQPIGLCAPDRSCRVGFKNRYTLGRFGVNYKF